MAEFEPRQLTRRQSFLAIASIPAAIWLALNSSGCEQEQRAGEFEDKYDEIFKEAYENEIGSIEPYYPSIFLGGGAPVLTIDFESQGELLMSLGNVFAGDNKMKDKPLKPSHKSTLLVKDGVSRSIWIEDGGLDWLQHPEEDKEGQVLTQQERQDFIREVEEIFNNFKNNPTPVNTEPLQNGTKQPNESKNLWLENRRIDLPQA